ncbi:PepSY domain-containing protein [Hymenobacter sp. BT664]|uniref:PepSY domain-containing protein n=1 Tax=Hymenobacter montanus TaxID=2771359 RepID=A0A927BH15_9BACT|nr:PepSY-associated TM helix domain-containing protein [Hymenobacter montanus]MBD2770014.1 PepSY domain-containing protein [Hymenobacter montanus]
MSPTKSLLRSIHRYLGLASGLVIVWVCLTGSILAFEKEIEQAWHPERYFVAPATTAPLPLAQVVEAVRARKPKAKIAGLKVYNDPTRTVEVSLAGGPGEGSKGTGPAATSKAGSPKGKGKGEGGGPRVYVNPYTAAITGEVNPRDTFFHTVEQLHRGLVAGKIGKLVMGVNASMFLFILGTGLVLWWPATRQALTSRLRVKWSSGWKRVNHDFHLVLGFYASLFLFVLALTGVGMSFDWVGEGINKLTHSPLKRPEPPLSAAPGAGAAPFAPAAALALARQQAPDAESYTIQLPKESTGSIRVAILCPGAVSENATDEVYLDQYSGRVISGQTYEQRPLGQRIRGLFKPVHTGAVGGWPTKVLVLAVSLLGATFPVTGTVMWLNRRRKQRRNSGRLQPA